MGKPQAFYCSNNEGNEFGKSARGKDSESKSETNSIKTQPTLLSIVRFFNNGVPCINCIQNRMTVVL